MKNNKLRLLIAGDKTRFVHLKQFITELEKIGIESKLIYDVEFIDKFFQMNIKKKIEKDRNLKMMLKEFDPDAILLDRISKIYILNLLETNNQVDIYIFPFLKLYLISPAISPLCILEKI